MIIDIIPCVVVTSLETDAFMAIVAYVDKLIVRAIERFGGTHLKFSGSTWFKIEFGKEKGNLHKGEPHERNPCASGFEEQPPEETSLQAGCTSKVVWNLARKFASSSRTLNYVLFSCEGARDTEDRMFIVCSGASKHNAEQGELSSDTLRRSNNPMCDLPRPGAVQVNE